MDETKRRKEKGVRDEERGNKFAFIGNKGWGNTSVGKGSKSKRMLLNFGPNELVQIHF